MSDPFVGEILMFGGNFAPVNYAVCDGALVAISSNEALFSLLGSTYGGDGQINFALPDLRGRLPLHQGHGPNLSPRTLGQRFGSESVQLTEEHLPPHVHQPRASKSTADSASGQGKLLGSAAAGSFPYTAESKTEDTVTLAPAQIGNAGSGQAHENRMPCLSINFIIALYGVYPSRN